MEKTFWIPERRKEIWSRWRWTTPIHSPFPIPHNPRSNSPIHSLLPFLHANQPNSLNFSPLSASTISTNASASASASSSSSHNIQIGMSTCTCFLGHDPFLSVEDDDDNFFESCERMSTAVPVNLDSIEYEDDDDDDDDYDDSRVSFSSAIGGPAPSSSDCRFSTVSMADLGAEEEYNVWMAEPISIEERRRRLLAGMGLSKELVQVDGADFSKLKSARVRSESGAAAAAATATPAPPAPAPAPTAEATTTAMTAAAAVVATRGAAREEIITSSSAESVLTRSRSDGSVVFPLAAERSGSAVTLRRSKSAPSALCGFRRQEATSGDSQIGSGMMGVRDGEASETGDGVFKIKDLNTGKEFVINELREDGSLNRLRDPETGKQLTMEEFEKCVGHSPIVKELMRRVNSEKQAEGGGGGGGRAPSMAGKSTKKRSWLKNIRGVANSVSELIGEWEKDNPLLGRSGRHATACAPNDWMKVHHHGKSYKEFTGLYMCQEIQAHKGSIWTIRFSSNAEYLASAGEDRVIHVWQVFDSDDLPSVISEELTSPLQSPMRGSHSMDRPPIPPLPADAHIWERKKRGKLSGSGRRGVRENVQVPSTMFSLSDKPICSFEGHQDDVLDLSWSKSQFNPIDDQYFISGSLDAKVRIWSIPDRQVVDWTDLHEMVTAACYTPDGKHFTMRTKRKIIACLDQGQETSNLDKCMAMIAKPSNYKLNQTAQIDIQPKKKKSSPKKMTGFQFSPAKPSEVLVTSADSQIRVFDGVDLIHKFREQDVDQDSKIPAVKYLHHSPMMVGM
ncbi:hypothetical protein ACLOJK_015366 [Asimina triloba]